jgi:hypothetical protein
MKRPNKHCRQVKLYRRTRGVSVLKLLVLFPAVVLLILLLVLAFHEGQKAYWDHRVGTLCTESGGVTVYEHVDVSLSQINAWGGVKGFPILPYEDDHRLDVPFYRHRETAWLREGNPRVRRDEVKYIRRHDGKVLGSYVYYARIGGDFLSWGHPTSFGCDAPKVPIAKRIFKIKEDM